MSNFRQALAFGQTGESLIANWFKARGYNILPAYEIEIESGKGPRLFTAEGNLICPDLLIFGSGKVFWIEAKHKSAFTWHRITGQWTTGIDLVHYDDYLKVAARSPWPVWLMFLQRDGIAKDTPPGKRCPTGLYGGELLYLSKHEHHKAPAEQWGKGGMVYWADTQLTKMAELDELCPKPSVSQASRPAISSGWQKQNTTARP